MKDCRQATMGGETKAEGRRKHTPSDLPHAMGLQQIRDRPLREEPACLLSSSRTSSTSTRLTKLRFSPHVFPHPCAMILLSYQNGIFLLSLCLDVISGRMEITILEGG